MKKLFYSMLALVLLGGCSVQVVDERQFLERFGGACGFGDQAGLVPGVPGTADEVSDGALDKPLIPGVDEPAALSAVNQRTEAMAKARAAAADARYEAEVRAIEARSAALRGDARGKPDPDAVSADLLGSSEPPPVIWAVGSGDANAFRNAMLWPAIIKYAVDNRLNKTKIFNVKVEKERISVAFAVTPMEVDVYEFVPGRPASVLNSDDADNYRRWADRPGNADSFGPVFLEACPDPALLVANLTGRGVAPGWETKSITCIAGANLVSDVTVEVKYEKDGERAKVLVSPKGDLLKIDRELALPGLEPVQPDIGEGFFTDKGISMFGQFVTARFPKTARIRGVHFRPNNASVSISLNGRIEDVRSFHLGKEGFSGGSKPYDSGKHKYTDEYLFDPSTFAWSTLPGMLQKARDLKLENAGPKPMMWVFNALDREDNKVKTVIKVDLLGPNGGVYVLFNPKGEVVGQGESGNSVAGDYSMMNWSDPY